jgi:hypothetical protein
MGSFGGVGEVAISEEDTVVVDVVEKVEVE